MERTCHGCQHFHRDVPDSVVARCSLRREYTEEELQFWHDDGARQYAREEGHQLFLDPPYPACEHYEG